MINLIFDIYSLLLKNGSRAPVHTPYELGLLSLVIPPSVGAMSTGDGFGHLCEETVPLKLRPYGAL